MVRPFQSIDLPYGEQTMFFRRGDSLPSIVVKVVDEKKVPLNLTGLRADFWVRRRSGIATSTPDWTGPLPGTILDATNGIVYYDTTVGDTTTNPGNFEMSLRLYTENTDDLLLTVPTDRDVFVELRDDPKGETAVASSLFGG